MKIVKYFGLGLIVIIGLFLIVVILPFERIAPPEKGYSRIVISNVNIVDIMHDSILRHKHVLIEDDRIKRVADKPISTGKDYKALDGTDKYLMPALWDMHVHLTHQAPHSAYQEFVANGVMHVRDMRGTFSSYDHFATTPDRIRRWNDEVASNELLGPTVHSIPSFAIEGPHQMFDDAPPYFQCKDSDDARQLIDYFKEQGIDLIKVYNNIPRDAFFTLMQEARSAGFDVAGHKPVRVSTIEAAEAGMKSLEHARFLIWDSFDGSRQLRNEDNPKQVVDTQLRRQMMDDHDTTMLLANLRAMRDNNTYYCPTHLTRKADAFADDPNFRARYDHINPIMRFLSFEDLDAVLNEDSSQLGRTVYMDFYLKGLEITGEAVSQGVKVLAGSDIVEMPGTSLIDELKELEMTGISGYEVLRTATLYPAEYYKLQQNFGSVEAGKNADLILLSDNPATEVSILKQPEALIHKGIYLSHEEIKHIKDEVRSRNNGLIMSAKLIWDILMYMMI